VAMAVHAEPLTGRDPVVVDDPQRAEAHVGGIVVIAKGECMLGVEPAVVEVPALGSFTYPKHACLSSQTWPYANNFSTTSPCTSVRRKSRPWRRNVSFLWSRPSKCRMVACRS